MRLIAKVVGADHRWAVRSRTAVCGCPTSGVTKTQTLLGEQTIVLWSLMTLHCSGISTAKY